MRNLRSIIILLVLFTATQCSVTKLQKQGYISSASSNYKGKFSTIKSLIILPVEIDGVTKNFLFDTGADVTLIQRDTIKGKTRVIGGATNRNMKLGNETIQSFKIGNVDFRDTYAMNGDFVGLKEQVPNFGGLIGQPIIKKANWLIDYPNQYIEISKDHLIDNTFESLAIKREGGSPYVYIHIDGEKFKALIDLGSSSAFSIPQNSKLAKHIISKYAFQDNEREVYSIGGLQKVSEKVGNIPSIQLEGFEFKNIKTTIKHTSQLRIGNDFFKDYMVYIDNVNMNYSLKKSN